MHVFARLLILAPVATMLVGCSALNQSNVESVNQTPVVGRVSGMVFTVTAGRWEPLGASTLGDSSSNPKSYVHWLVGADENNRDYIALKACYTNWATITKEPACVTTQTPMKISDYAITYREGLGSHGLEQAYMTVLAYRKNDPNPYTISMTICAFNRLGFICSPIKSVP